MVRTASLIVALLTATAIASRISDDAVAAHQICVQVLLFLALALDALAIAGQAMVGRFLGAASVHDARAVGRRLHRARHRRRRALRPRASWSLRPWLAGVFTDDAGVRHLALEVLWIVAALQPVAAVVFVLDGVLIGAGDAGYLALAMLVATVGVYLPAAVLVAVLDGGLLWLWGALALWMLARFVGMVGRFRTDALGGRGRVAHAMTPGRPLAVVARERLSWADARVRPAAAPRRLASPTTAERPVSGAGARRRATMTSCSTTSCASTRGVAANACARSPARSTTRCTGTGSGPSGKASSTSRSTAARCWSPTTPARSRPTRR